MFQHILKEPLLHFLVLGGLLFLAFSLVSDDTAPSDDEIVVTGGKIAQLEKLFTRTWQRQPTRAELEGLVNNWVREEAAYREAMSLGLERNDTVVRRRMRQKMELLAEGLVGMASPSEEDLRTYLKENPDRFRTSPRISFRQIFLGQANGDLSSQEARDLLASLHAGTVTDASVLGNNTFLEYRYSGWSDREIAKLLGARFASTLIKLPLGEWRGPVESGYGAHLVIVDTVEEGHVPRLEEIRERVLVEWKNERREAALEAFYKKLLGRYRVVIQWPVAEGSGEQS